MKLDRSIGATLFALAALAIAVAPSADAAAIPPGAFSSGQEAEFEATGSSGFRVHFALSQRAFGAAASKGPATVSYNARGGSAEDGRFAGTLPGIGRVSVRFHQHGKTRRLPILCRQAPTLVRPGYFVGTVHLRGEHDYTEVDATRVKGAVSETPHRNCAAKRTGHRSALMRTMKSKEAQTLLLQAKAGDVTFVGGQISVGKKEVELSILGASHTRRHDGMLVENTVIEFGSSPVVLPSEDVEFPKSATVEPPEPFSGSAAFELQSSHTSTWTGDLAVELPGVGKVRLAGPRFRSNLCVAKDCGGSLPPEHGTHYVQIIR
jgi:hypothetical protein